MENEKIKLLIVDDSAVAQQILRKIFALDPTIEVVGSAANAYEAREMIKSLDPDVITLDVEMPEMDGITFLKNLMRLHPLPVVMVSSFTKKGSEYALEALALGAIDYIQKPRENELDNFTEYTQNLIAIIKNASKARIRSPLLQQVTAYSPQQNSIIQCLHPSYLQNYIIGIGASTGGVEAIERLLSQLPANIPGIVIVQHIHRDFSSSFLQRLNRKTRAMICEAAEGLEIKPGHIYMAKAGIHLTVKRIQNKYFCSLENSPLVNGHKPSVDTLFISLAAAAKKNAIAILLTGMGKDGGQGMKAVQNAGGETICQDEASSVVWGMPGFAVKLTAANKIVPIEQIGQHVIEKIIAGAARKKWRDHEK